MFGTTLLKLPYAPSYILNEFCSRDLEFEPGTKFKYNNSGYFILAQIIEKVTARPYQLYYRKTSCCLRACCILDWKTTFRLFKIKRWVISDLQIHTQTNRTYMFRMQQVSQVCTPPLTTYTCGTGSCTQTSCLPKTI